MKCRYFNCFKQQYMWSPWSKIALSILNSATMKAVEYFLTKIQRNKKNFIQILACQSKYAPQTEAVTIINK